MCLRDFPSTLHKGTSAQMPEEDLGPGSQMKTPRNEAFGAGNVNMQKSMTDRGTLTLTAIPLRDWGLGCPQVWRGWWRRGSKPSICPGVSGSCLMGSFPCEACLGKPL